MTALEVEVLPAGVDGWVERIRGHLSSSVESIVAAGADLVSAKAALRHGEFGDVVAGLGMSMDTAQKLMAVARCEPIAKTAPVRLLPASYSTLYELSRLPDDVLAEALDGGLVGPATTRAEVQELVSSLRPKMSPGCAPGDETEDRSTFPSDVSTGSVSAAAGDDPTPSPAAASSVPPVSVAAGKLAKLASNPDLHRTVRGYAKAQLDVVDPFDEAACASALADVKAVQFVAGLVGQAGRVGQAARTALDGIESGDLAASRAAQLVRRVVDGEGAAREGAHRSAPPAPSSPSLVDAGGPAPASTPVSGYDGAQGLQPHHRAAESRKGRVGLDQAELIVATARGLLEAFDAAGGAGPVEAWCAARPERAAEVSDVFDSLRRHVSDAYLLSRP